MSVDELVGVALAVVGVVVAAAFAYGKTGLEWRLRRRREDLVEQVAARVRDAGAGAEPTVEPPGAYPLDAAERAAIEFVLREYGRPMASPRGAPGEPRPAR